jgi:hypothetical protein
MEGCRHLTRISNRRFILCKKRYCYAGLVSGLEMHSVREEDCSRKGEQRREDCGVPADISGVKHLTGVTRDAFHLEKVTVENFIEAEATGTKCSVALIAVLH